MSPRVADVIADALRTAHVTRVFAADGADASLAAALRAGGVAVVAVSTGASACVMAAITGMLGDAPGVALLGVAVSDVVPVLAAAWRDRAACVMIAPAALPGSAEPKATIEITAESVIHAVAGALAVATDEPPGPVCLRLPPATPPAPADASAAAWPASDVCTRRVAAPIDVRQVEAVAQRLATCERPLIVAGRECRAPDTAGWLRAFAESLPAPVLVTPAARGVIPDPHPLSFGLLRRDAAVLARADFTIALGVDAAELDAAGVTFPGPAVCMGRGTGNDTVGDIASLLEELAPRLRGRVRVDWDVAELDRLRRTLPAPAVDPPLATLVERIREATPAGTTAVFSRALESLGALWLVTGPAELFVADAVMPAAVAVALARPETATLAFARGDDAPLAELAAAVDARARVIVLVVDGMIDDSAAPAGARVARPLSLPALLTAVGDALDREALTIVAVPRAG